MYMSNSALRKKNVFITIHVIVIIIEEATGKTSHEIRRTDKKYFSAIEDHIEWFKHLTNMAGGMGV